MGLYRLWLGGGVVVCLSNWNTESSMHSQILMQSADTWKVNTHLYCHVCVRFLSSSLCTSVFYYSPSLRTVLNQCFCFCALFHEMHDSLLLNDVTVCSTNQRDISLSCAGPPNHATIHATTFSLNLRFKCQQKLGMVQNCDTITLTFKKLSARCKLSTRIIVKKRYVAGKKINLKKVLNESCSPVYKYIILIFIRCMAGGTTTLSSESPWPGSARHGARGPGASTLASLCHMEYFFQRKPSVHQQTRQLLKPAVAKVNPRLQRLLQLSYLWEDNCGSLQQRGKTGQG